MLDSVIGRSCLREDGRAAVVLSMERIHLGGACKRCWQATLECLTLVFRPEEANGAGP